MQLIDAVEVVDLGGSALAVLESESESLSSLELDEIGDAACS
jgi:hypothetical protein